MLSASSPQEAITCVAASGCALANTPHSKQALCCYKNNSFSVPPPLLDPVKDKNQPLSSLPPSLKAHRLSQKLFNPNPVALKRPVVRGSQSARLVIRWYTRACMAGLYSGTVTDYSILVSPLRARRSLQVSVSDNLLK